MTEMNANGKVLYFYKDKPYTITNFTQIKIGGQWLPIIYYHCEYENQEGENWCRFENEFFDLFKTRQIQ